MKLTLLCCLVATSTFFSAQGLIWVVNKTSQPITISAYNTTTDWNKKIYDFTRVVPEEPIIIDPESEIDLYTRLIPENLYVSIKAIEVIINEQMSAYCQLQNIEKVVFVETKDGDIVMSIPGKGAIADFKIYHSKNTEEI